MEATVPELVHAASRGDPAAWTNLVKTYMPLVVGVTHRYRLFGQDADDVCQTVWLRLVEHLTDLRDPQALPHWLATTTRNEALRLIMARKRTKPVDPVEGSQVDVQVHDDAEAVVLIAERRQALREALAELAPHQQQLLLLLIADPPLSYAQISGRLGIPIGSIGPTRARCLERLRASNAIRALNVTQRDVKGTGGRNHEFTPARRR